MELGGMAPTLKQTIQDQISKGNIHVENDEASTSEQAAGMGKKADDLYIDFLLLIPLGILFGDPSAPYAY